MTIKCAICGKDFETIYPQQKYCSGECRKIKEYNRLRQYDLDHPDRHKKYNKKKVKVWRY